MSLSSKKKETLNLWIPGEPKTKLRPRFSRFKRFVRTYDSQSEERDTVKWQLRSRMLGRDPLDGPLRVDLIFIFPVPKSRRNRKEIYHSVKPDIDNCIKWILDAGNEILWHDDKQIVNVYSIKIYGDNPRTIITAGQVNASCY